MILVSAVEIRQNDGHTLTRPLRATRTHSSVSSQSGADAQACQDE